MEFTKNNLIETTKKYYTEVSEFSYELSKKFHRDNQKYQKGMHPLVSHIHSMGMTFGLWFEPEMVSPDSDLFRSHPDWILGEKDQTLGREQYVLDISIKEVQEYLFKSIDKILNEYPIDYIKWDHNRVLPHPDASQTRALYRLLNRIRPVSYTHLTLPTILLV